MSAITYLTNIVTSLTNRFNQIETNSKKVDELPAQTTLEPSSKIPVSRAGESEHITVQQIISSIEKSNYNQLTSFGDITIDETDIIIEPVSGQINGNNYATTTNTTIPVVLCDSGFNRKDILVLTTSNTIVAISGEETDGSIIIAPPVPLDAVFITKFDVSDSVIGTPTDPFLGTSFVKKSFSTPFISDVSGADAIIPLNPNGYSEIRLTNPALTSIAGYDLSLITGNPTAEVPYNGKPYIIRNLTGNSITIKNELGAADCPFYLTGAADLIFPDNQAIYVSYDVAGFQEVFKSWSEVDLSTKADLVAGKVPSSQLPSYVDDVLEFENLAAFPVTGETGKIYVALDTNLTYRWSGSAYVKISDSGKLDKVTTVDEEKVYIKNADGTQGVKPTSEFGGREIYIENISVSGGYTVDFDTATYRLTLIRNTTFTEINLPPVGFSKTITLHVSGNFGIVFPASWTQYISGAYKGTARLNTIVVEAFGNFRKVQISQPD